MDGLLDAIHTGSSRPVSVSPMRDYLARTRRMFKAMLELAAGNLSQKELADWFRAHLLSP
ncbi:MULTISPECIES: hypothetical protein [Sphingobium]|uniref:Uncharacterized protein n=1 Tax=Sphingobium baderi TaxID=1332080 RepID=A0A0S3EW85_9SPHN|nr:MULTISPECIES: hypothetical protein [Sphingobium]ALR19634.1 hypothetical protein ATN00_04240 [Sphingobium baderi]